ncbi:MAG TPA: S-CspCI protein [Lentisphaeria bacterium]|nr:MAG: S-CspCI protein [Lentisphaerae bacterium GWF2_49_21]HBC89438.1 S-CspCI protein [Lentisphaeria bacterium]
MKQIRITEIFDIKYGHSLELNRLRQVPSGINYVSRTSSNNGISAIVALIQGMEPMPAGTITVSLGGSVLETFLQPQPYYTGYHIYCLTSKIELSTEEKLFYCVCINANKYRYNYGRQANRTLKNLMLPDKMEIPDWVYKSNIHCFDNAKEPFLKKSQLPLDMSKWKWYQLQELFDIKKGKRLTKANMTIGDIPFIGSIDSNNGYRQLIGHEPIHEKNTITVNYNGSVAEAFYQPEPFCASDDVNVLYPKFNMNQYIALFFVTLIKMEKYRFNYGRKWHVERMKESKIKVPVKNNNKPDYKYMENYIKSLPFSKEI